MASPDPRANDFSVCSTAIKMNVIVHQAPGKNFNFTSPGFFLDEL
jgi:hypothetical protein